MNCTDINISELVPHSGYMLLLDRVLSVSTSTLCCEVIIRHDSPFCDGQSVGAWVGVEYMAQTIAAFAGYQARQRGEAVKVGFLLGSRRYESVVPVFPVGSVLRVTAQRILQGENGLGSFECSIDGDARLVTATLTVYQPQDVGEFLKGVSE